MAELPEKNGKRPALLSDHFRRSDQSLGAFLPRGNRRRRDRVAILLSDPEWEHLVEVARSRGREPACFVREIALAALPPLVAVAPLLRELCRAGNALVQLAAVAKASGAMPEAERLESALAELLAVARRLEPVRVPGQQR